jgi:hypothetical protein
MEFCQAELYGVSKYSDHIVHLLTSVLHNKSSYSNRGVGGHLFRAKTTAFESFLPQFRCPIYDGSVA